MALTAPSLVLLATAPSSAETRRILPNVQVAGVEVGGLTGTEAVEALSTKVADELSREITIQAPDREFVVTLRDLGGQADLEGAVERALKVGRRETVASALREAADSILGSHQVDLPVELDPARTQAVVEALAAEIRCDPEDASAEVVDGELVVEPHRVGIAPDVDATVDALMDAARTGLSAIDFPVSETQPEVLTAHLDDLELISTFTTHFSTGQVNRATNIRVGASLIDGTVVPPGAVFSVNQTTGRRTPEKGFQVAPVFSGQEVIFGVGGGVCQISTTIYNAVLEAGLKVVERHQHSMPVHYVPWGRDATISYGAADFRFQNDSGGPLIVRTTVDGGYLTCSLLGRGSKAEAPPETSADAETKTVPDDVKPVSDEPLTRGAPPYTPASDDADAG
jgi:vancomycin resistance protein YoaR